MESNNTYHITLTQDVNRDVETWHFCDNGTERDCDLLRIHNAALDMFLNRQPILVLPDSVHIEGTSYIARDAKLIHPIWIKPPYSQFLLNIYAMELLPGESVRDKMAELYFLQCEKELLQAWLEKLQVEHLMIVTKT